ncbi:MAG TPA: hypothetical protein VNN17_02405 [Terriglobia bacterium]|nr:hypothetical protein [Terriglobia bacterium]
MSAAQFLCELERRGIVLEARGNHLHYRAPKGRLTPDLVESLRQHKAELLRLLAGEAKTGYGLCPEPDHCAGCYSIGVVDGRERFLHPPKGKPISWAALQPATEKVQ